MELYARFGFLINVNVANSAEASHLARRRRIPARTGRQRGTVNNRRTKGVSSTTATKMLAKS